MNGDRTLRILQEYFQPKIGGDASRMVAFEMLYLLFVHLFSCRLTSQRELVFTLSVKMEQRGWETASLEFKGSLLGICTVKEELIEYG